MSKNLSEWKLAKELCEKAAHLSPSEKIEYINSSQESTSVKDKALNIINKFEEDFELIENSIAEDIIPLSPQKNNLVGKIIDNYELTEMLGSGGMSSVYLAKRTQSDIQKYVALKILSPYHTAQKYLELFYREQQSLAQLNHKNIVSFHHGGQTEDGTNYLVMDYIENATDILNYNKSNNSDLIHRLKQIETIARAMSYAHGKNIIHRDLKSANILVDVQNEIKIVDFGIAFVSSSESHSSDSTKVFTQDIASPEQIQGKAVDVRTDIFSLGALLLQLATDKQPLPKIDINQYNPINDQKHVEKVLKSSGLNRDLKNIIRKAMHIDVERRYASMQDFADDIQNFLAYKPVKAGKDSILYKFNKLYKRNQLVSTLILVILFIAIGALYFVNNYSTQSKKALRQKDSSMAVINALFEQADPFKNTSNSKELVKTLEKIEVSQMNQLNTDPEFSYEFYQNMTKIYNQNANYNQALKSKAKAIKSLNKFATEDDLRIFERKVEELSLLHATGQFSKAVEQSNLFLQKLAKNPEIKPVLTLMTFITLSRSYAGLNQLDEQTKVHKLSIEFMNNHPEIEVEFQADMLASMAIAQFRNNNRKMANDLFEKTIKAYQKLPDRKTSLAGTIRNYAATQVNYGNYEKADKLFQQSIDIFKNIDANHPTLASSYLRYASLLGKTGQIQKAQDLLLRAVDIFNEANDTIELPIAHTYLAELELRKNNIDSAINYILLANTTLQEKFQLDHPRTIKTYNLALWILLIEPYSDYAHKIMTYLDNQDYINSKSSKEYAFYQNQKDLLFHQNTKTNQRLSLLSHYLYGGSLKSTQQKLDWLNQQINLSEKQTPLVNAYLNLWLLEISPDVNHYKTICQPQAQWMYSLRLALKVNLMEQCLKIAEMNKYKNPDDFEKILNDFEIKVFKSKPLLVKFVDELTKQKREQ